MLRIELTVALKWNSGVRPICNCVQVQQVHGEQIGTEFDHSGAC